jgi:hypothetical protein
VVSGLGCLLKLRGRELPLQALGRPHAGQPDHLDEKPVPEAWSEPNARLIPVMGGPRVRIQKRVARELGTARCGF